MVDLDCRLNDCSFVNLKYHFDRIEPASERSMVQ